MKSFARRHCIGVLASSLLFVSSAAFAAPVARVGAVNWDCSVPSSTFFGTASIRALSPAKYRDRTPYYAQKIDDDAIDYRERTLEEYEREMLYAIDAGIDYFAYCWYDKTPPPGSLPGASETCRAADGHLQELTRARELHVRSGLRTVLGFCAILVVTHPYSNDELEALVDAMNDPGYEKIDGRPLVYAYAGPWREPVARLRSICSRKGIADPYVALMCGGKAVPKAEDIAGADALTAYACPAEAKTFAALVDISMERNANRAKAGIPVIPHISLGWDPSPRIDNPVPWATYPKGSYSVAKSQNDFVTAARAMKDWIRDNPKSTPTGHVLAFAWNEFEEGGWICPSMVADGGPDESRVQMFRIVSDALKCERAKLVWKDRDLAQWSRSVRDVSDLCLTNRALQCRVSGGDPSLELMVAEPFRGNIDFVVRIRLKTSIVDEWDFFWESDGNGRYGSPDVSHFAVLETNVWRIVEFRPTWSGDGMIRKMRIDPPERAGCEVEIGEISVLKKSSGFRPVDAEEFTGVAFRLATEAMEYGAIRWHATGARGMKMMPFTTAADGAEHTYWFDIAKEGKTFKTAGPDCWKGTVDFLSVDRMPGVVPFAAKDIRMVSGTPDLPPDIGISSVMPAEAIPRAGRPFALEIVLRNYGTRPADGIRFSFPRLPDGLAIADARELSPTGAIAAATGRDSVGIGHDLAKWRLPNERVFRVTLNAPPVGRHSFELEVAADGCEPRRKAVDVEVLPSLGLARSDYVPEPKPVRTGLYHVGATSFPGWTLHDWHAIRSRAPERKPVLGWYDESNAEAVDWQIKQLVENGISWLLVCWYWDCETKSPGAGISVWPETFHKARYRRYLKWCLQWGARSSWKHRFTVEDMRDAARYWCEHYFNTDEYLKIGGRPVVNIFTAEELVRKFSLEEARSFLAAANECAKAAGFDGIYFVGQRQRSDSAQLAEIASIGFERTSTYKYLLDDVPPFRWIAPRCYGELAENSLRHWRRLGQDSPMTFFPSLSTGYDPRPWIGAVDCRITTNVTVAAFRKICEDAKKFSDETGERYLLMGPLDEWGEGSIGYPNRRHGFGMLEAVRDTFGEKPPEGWPVNCAPEDVGLVCPQR